MRCDLKNQTWESCVVSGAEFAAAAAERIAAWWQGKLVFGGFSFIPEAGC